MLILTLKFVLIKPHSRINDGTWHHHLVKDTMLPCHTQQEDVMSPHHTDYSIYFTTFHTLPKTPLGNLGSILRVKEFVLIRHCLVSCYLSLNSILVTTFRFSFLWLIQLSLSRTKRNFIMSYSQVVFCFVHMPPIFYLPILWEFWLFPDLGSIVHFFFGISGFMFLK